MTQKTEPDYPQTVDEAIDQLLDVMKPEDIEKIRQMKESDLISLHFGLGMYIRNNFGLWKKESRLSHGFAVGFRMRKNRRRGGGVGKGKNAWNSGHFRPI